MEEDDDEAMHEELKEAFRLYDKEGEGLLKNLNLVSIFFGPYKIFRLKSQSNLNKMFYIK